MLVRLDNTEHHAPSFIHVDPPMQKGGSVLLPPHGSCAISEARARELEDTIRGLNEVRTHKVLKDEGGRALRYRSVSLFLIDDDGSAAPVDADTLFDIIGSDKPKAEETAPTGETA